MKKCKENIFLNRRGMTFVEVIVTIAVFSIIMVGVNQLFIKSWQNYNFIIKTSEALIAANRGISSIVDVLRRVSNADNGTYALLGAEDFDLKVFSDIDKDGVVEKVHYYLNGTNLMVGQSNPSGFPLAYPIVDDEVSVLIGNVMNDSGQPLFYYYDGENNIMSLPSGSINDIRMIEVSLIIDRQNNDIAIESFASMRNLSDYDTIK